MLGSLFFSSHLIITITHLSIIESILSIQYAAGRQKAFSTYASHLAAVTIFYVFLIFTYMNPDDTLSLTQTQVASVFYPIVISLLNPLIYSLRNKM
jgi:olfactory receptor